MGLTRNYAQTIYNWLSTFAPTFREPILSGYFDNNNPKPDEYITYSSLVGSFGNEFTQAITIYSKSTAYTRLMNIVDAIETAIGENGLNLSNEWGYITIYKGSPFYQDKEDEDDSYRAGYINLTVTIYQTNI